MTGFDWKNAKPYWRVQGRYEYWAVDEYREGDPSNAKYGSLTFRTKKDAEKMCYALNAAAIESYIVGYAHGKEDGPNSRAWV